MNMSPFSFLALANISRGDRSEYLHAHEAELILLAALLPSDRPLNDGEGVDPAATLLLAASSEEAKEMYPIIEDGQSVSVIAEHFGAGELHD